MARDLDHLELPQVSGSLPRRLRGGGRPPKRDNKEQHGEHLLEETKQIVSLNTARSRPAGITPALVFRLKLHPHADIEENMLQRMGLSVISKEADKTIVVFSSDEE